MDFDKAEIFIAEMMEGELPPGLTYHNYEHMQEVMKAAMQLAKEEGITDHDSLTLLKTAALFHDSGFVNTYSNHEEEGCRLASDLLPGFGYSDAQIETINKMIMKTKLPSQPETLLEKILCDADLDYLGRDDFFTWGDRLFDELQKKGRLESRKEWDEMQVQFLESHRYWTSSAIFKREPKKQKHLDFLKAHLSFNR